MTTDVKIAEDLWDTDSEAVITAWFVKDGGKVEKGALLAEVMTEKIQHEIKSPAEGAVSILKKTDEIVKKGDVIARIE